MVSGEPGWRRVGRTGGSTHRPDNLSSEEHQVAVTEGRQQAASRHSVHPLSVDQHTHAESPLGWVKCRLLQALVPGRARRVLGGARHTSGEDAQADRHADGDRWVARLWSQHSTARGQDTEYAEAGQRRIAALRRRRSARLTRSRRNGGKEDMVGAAYGMETVVLFPDPCVLYTGRGDHGRRRRPAGRHDAHGAPRKRSRSRGRIPRIARESHPVQSLTTDDFTMQRPASEGAHSQDHPDQDVANVARERAAGNTPRDGDDLGQSRFNTATLLLHISFDLSHKGATRPCQSGPR